MAETTISDAFERYHRQMLLPGIGPQGQQRLCDAHVLIVGCGALGGVIAESLTRAGVGTLSIVDRDVVELTNLQRQVLFDEADARDGAPKAVAAKRRLSQINLGVTVHAYVDDLSSANAERFIPGVDLILDALDNYETRYLLNDLAVKHHLPLIHGGAVGWIGTAMTILPGISPCLRCVFPELPAPGTAATCDTAGVLGPLVMMIAAHQSCEAIKLLTGNHEALDRSLLSIDSLRNRGQRTDISAARDMSCPCCVRREFAYLDGSTSATAVTLCGRDAVQVNPAFNDSQHQFDLPEMARRLSAHGRFSHNEHLLRGEFANERSDSGQRLSLTLFPTGRAVIKGTDRPEVARTIYARYLGS